MEPGRVVLTALLVLSQLLSPLAANADDAKPVYQDTDSNGANYLANRRALVGPGCVINSLFDGVKVVAGTADLQNLVDDDLTNNCKLPSVADIGAAVDGYVVANGFSTVKKYVGHGVGEDLHEDPNVPNFGTAGRGARLCRGMVIAIEPMVNVGRPEVKELADNWTVVTKDGSLSAHYEHTIALTADGVEVLTKVD